MPQHAKRTHCFFAIGRMSSNRHPVVAAESNLMNSSDYTIHDEVALPTLIHQVIRPLTVKLGGVTRDLQGLVLSPKGTSMLSWLRKRLVDVTRTGTFYEKVVGQLKKRSSSCTRKASATTTTTTTTMWPQKYHYSTMLGRWCWSWGWRLCVSLCRSGSKWRIA